MRTGETTLALHNSTRLPGFAEGRVRRQPGRNREALRREIAGNAVALSCRPAKAAETVGKAIDRGLPFAKSSRPCGTGRTFQRLASPEDIITDLFERIGIVRAQPQSWCLLDKGKAI